MSKKPDNRQQKLDELKAQLAEKQHPQQSSDRKKRLADAQKIAEKMLAKAHANSEED